MRLWPKGRFSDGFVTADIVANDQISIADDYKPIVVGYHNGGAVRLADVANVTDAVSNIRSAGFLNGIPAVMMIIFASRARISSRPSITYAVSCHI